ncbi:MAG: hypothetical protein EBZ47_00030 [Chlamydiae bacterium]|nr:hypothetical protein [Chlamydiota bacterium]
MPGYEKISDLPPSKSRRTLSIHTPSKDYFLPVFYLGFFALENYRQLGFQSLKPELILLLSPLSPEERENLVVLFAPLHRPSFSEEASLNILKALVSLPADQKNTIVSLAKPLCLMVDRSQSIVNVVEALAQLQEEDRKQIQALLLSYCQVPFQYNLSDLIPILNQVPPNQREFLAHIARPLYQGLKCRASSGSLMATLANVMPRQRAKVVELALEWGSEFVFIEERYAMLSAAAKIWPIFSSDFRQCLLQQLQMRPGFYEKMDVLHQVMAIPHFKRDAVGLSVFLICSQVVSSKALSEIFDLFLSKKTIEPSMILFGKYLFEKEFPMDEKLTLLREIFIRIDHLKLNQVSVIEEIKAATQGWQLLEKWQSNR